MRTAYKVLAALSALSISSLVQADCCSSWYQDPNYTFETAYIGLMGGVGNLNNRVQVTAPVFGLNTSTTLTQNFATGGIDFGFATAVDRWYIGIDLNSLPVPVSQSKSWSSQGFSLSDDTKLINFANIDAMPGFYVTNNFIIYLRAGVGISRIDLDQNNFAGKTYTLDDTTYGPQGGIGFDIGLCNSVSIGADYTYTYYTQSSFTETDAVTTNTYTFKVQPKENYVGLHLRYNFLV